MTDAPFLVIAGSVRATRRSPAIAAWVAGLGREATGRAFDPVDLLTLDLGLGDEPGLPAKGVYARESTKRWSARVAASAGVVIVTPQYNWGYPAALKNAVDHLHGEWRGKPVLIVSYGGHGGGKCAAQLREVFAGLDTRQVETSPGLKLARDKIVADDGGVDPEADFADSRDEVSAALKALVALAETPAP